MISFLGTGLLGSAFVRALLKKGEQVKVWNRSKVKAEALVAEGALPAETLADAVQGVSRVHLVLSDDASVDSVLAAAEPALQPGTYLIDHTTTSVDGARKRTAEWAAKGIHYVHVPVFMGPANALEGSGVMLLSGAPALLEPLRPWLAPMTGKLVELGEETGRAAAVKLLGNMFLITLTGGFSDMLATAQAMDVPPTAISDLFASWNPGALAPGRYQRIVSAPFDEPSWELQMARKDARLMMEEAAKGGKELTVIPAVAKVMDEWIEKGFGKKDWTVIVKDHLPGE